MGTFSLRDLLFSAFTRSGTDVPYSSSQRVASLPLCTWVWRNYMSTYLMGCSFRMVKRVVVLLMYTCFSTISRLFQMGWCGYLSARGVFWIGRVFPVWIINFFPFLLCLLCFQEISHHFLFFSFMLQATVDVVPWRPLPAFTS